METTRNIARHSSALTLAFAGNHSSASLVVLLTLLLCFALPANANAQQRAEGRHSGQSPVELSLPAVAIQQFDTHERSEYSFPRACTGGHINEVIPDKYKKRYQKWKREFLASETGRRQWETYAHHPRLVLTITVSGDRCNGAITDKLKWDDSGNLIAATIALGRRIDEGYPGPANYPVLSSLARFVDSGAISKHILAAAKIAHEFGHVNRMVDSNGALYGLQSQLVLIYNTTLLGNGHNTRDPRLVKLAREMGGTPVEIWEDREYLAEANAMLYLRDRIAKESLRRSLFNGIKQTTEEYAKGFERFVQIALSQWSPSLVPVGVSVRPVTLLQNPSPAKSCRYQTPTATSRRSSLSRNRKRELQSPGFT